MDDPFAARVAESVIATMTDHRRGMKRRRSIMTRTGENRKGLSCISAPHAGRKGIQMSASRKEVLTDAIRLSLSASDYRLDK